MLLIGEGKDGLACIRFGMVVAETDVPALANLVRQTGQEIETSTHELETMAVMVRKGKGLPHCFYHSNASALGLGLGSAG